MVWEAKHMNLWRGMRLCEVTDSLVASRRRQTEPRRCSPRGRSPRQRLIVVPLLLGLLVLAGCAGYQIGNRSLYRTDIKTINVPMFKSNTLRIDLGEWLTEAVVKEIELRTPYKVISDPLADSVLTGNLLAGDEKQVLNENINDEPRNLLYHVAVHVTWLDNSGCILMQSIVTLGSEFVPEAGQSITTAQDAAIRKLAQQIVSQMEAQNW